MSPEQVLGAHLDHRSDIYAVGALAYELISYRERFPERCETARCTGF